jgi:hypothetical protein
MLQQRRPQRAADIVAGGRHPDRDPAMAHEPLRHIGQQRAEGRRGTDANEQMHQRKRERGRNQRRTDKADAKRQAAQHDRDHDAEAVAQPSHCDTAQGVARHCKRIRQGGIGAGYAEISLHERQSNWHRPRADAADGADRDRKSSPPPCRRRVDIAKLAITQIHGTAQQRVHDADLSWPACVVNPARLMATTRQSPGL